MNLLKSDRRALCLGLGLALVIHLAGVFGVWHYDDYHVLVTNPHLDDPRAIPAFFVDAKISSADPRTGMYRPVLMVSFAINRWICGRAPWGFLAGNLLVHLAACALAFSLARELARGAGWRARPARRVAALVMFLFALHPVLVETVSYVSARSSGLATVWVLGAVWCGLRATRPERLRWDYAVAAALAAALGCLTKEIAVTAPLLFATCALACGGQGGQRGRWRRVLAQTAVLLAVVLVFLLVRRLVLGSAVPDLSSRGAGADAFRGSQRSPWVNLLTQIIVVARYLGLLLWPGRLSIDHGARIVVSPFDVSFLLALGLLGALTVWSLRHPRRRPLRAAGWIWFALALGPTSSILPLNVLMNEHRLYLPAFGIFLVAASALEGLRSARWWRRRAPRRVPRGALVAAGLVLLGARALVRKFDWWSEERIWSGALEVNPGSPIVCLGYANVLVQRGDLQGATALLERAVALDPKHNAGRINLSECLLRRYEARGEEADLERALVLLAELHRERPRNTLIALKAARAFQLRYRLHGKRSDAEAAEEQLRGILQVDPRHGVALACLRRYRAEWRAGE